MGSVGGGRVRTNTDPNHNGTGSLFPVLSMGDEADRANGVAIHSALHQVANLGTNNAPDGVERGAMDSMNRLGRLVSNSKSASGLDPGVFV